MRYRFLAFLSATCAITVAIWAIAVMVMGDADPARLSVSGVVEDADVSPTPDAPELVPTAAAPPAPSSFVELGEELPQTPAHLLPPASVEATTTVAPPTTLPATTVPVVTVPPTTVPVVTVPPATTRAPTTTTVPPAHDPGSIAATFLADLNRLRSSHGLSALARDGGLDALAQSWAQTMATDGSLRHSGLVYQVIDGSWNAVGENISYGSTEASMFAGFEASAGHLANMVNADYTHVGIGVTVMGDVIWTTHLFAG